MKWYYWLLVVLLALLGWWAFSLFYPSKFEPVQLTVPEELVFQRKLTRLDPDAYTEEGVSRELIFTEKELNSVISADKTLSESVHINLSPGLITVKGILDIPEGIPLLGEKRVNFAAGLGLELMGDKPSLILKGVSLGGLPIPAAWLGGVKGENLIEQFDINNSLLTSGFEEIKVERDRIVVKLKE